MGLVSGGWCVPQPLCPGTAWDARALQQVSFPCSTNLPPLFFFTSSSSSLPAGCSLAWGLCSYPEVFEVPHPSHGRGESRIEGEHATALVGLLRRPAGDLGHAQQASPLLPLVCQVLPASPCTGLASPVPAKRVGRDGGTGWMR